MFTVPLHITLALQVIVSFLLHAWLDAGIQSAQALPSDA